MSIKNQIHLEYLPNHIAIIMDGNGRWAKERGKLRVFGHEKGAYSGADKTRQGLIAKAMNGTIFLDEIGDLP